MFEKNNKEFVNIVRLTSLIFLATVGLLIGGCDVFEVENPGPQPDDALNDPDAYRAVVDGAKRAYSDALGQISTVSGAAVREIFPSGNTGRFGISVNEGQGRLEPDEAGPYWDAAQNARWVAGDAVRRFRQNMEASEFESSELVAESYLWAGLSNRLLGENFRRAVFDSGEPRPRTAFLDSAEKQLTTAIEIARSAGDTEIEHAAQAARATVRMDLGDWESAVSDARSVIDGAPDSFSFEAPYFNVSENQYNYVYWASANSPYRGHSTWNTPYESYYQDTEDPRVSWGQDPEFPTGSTARECCGPVPWYFQTKYESTDANIDVVDKREMWLIVAEDMLRQGDWEEALNVINQELRSGIDEVGQLSASSPEKAWTLFRRERGIELWLEGRRMNDLRRWKEADRIGSLHPLEDPSNEDSFLDPDRDLTWPIPDSERQTNPNL
jgi:tetratricopeptide (TPR) repeat protein